MTRILLFASLGLAIAACSKADAHSDNSSASPVAPGTNGVPIETRLAPPAGYVTTIFATVPGARAMTVGDDGAVYVSQPSSNQIIRLVDANRDGVAEKSIAVRGAGLNRPHGMAFRDGYFYIANTDGVVRVKLDSSGKAAGVPEQLNHYSGEGGRLTLW